MSRRSVVLPFVLFTACHSAPPPAAGAAAAQPAARSDATADSAQKAADERRQREKELRQKQRDLELARTELQVAEIDRTERTLTVERALAKTAAERDSAAMELQVFLDDVKPRRLEEQRIDLDQNTYRAEHQKDELGELTAMYEADEFARSTKELVLKRGRRDLEMAERRLAVAQKEMKHLEQIELPRRERELRQKLADAELEKKKSELGAEKAKLELEMAQRKASAKIADLEQDIAELQAKLAAGEEDR